MYHYVIPFSKVHVHVHTRTRTRTRTRAAYTRTRTTLLHNHYTTCSVWPHPHPYTNVWPGVVLHVKECLQTCCFVVVSFHTQIQSFSFITCPINQLCAQICPYYNVWPGAVYCCFNKNYKVYNILNMTLHALLVNPTCLQSLRVWYCSVCEIRESNQRRRRRR